MRTDLIAQILDEFGADEIDEVQIGLDEAKALMEKAEKHMKSAVLIRDSDIPGAYLLTYDCALNGLQAFMAALGLRFRTKPGHYAYVRLISLGFFESPEFALFNTMRTMRHQTAYFDPDKPQASAQDLFDALQATGKMLDEIYDFVQ